MSGAAEIGHKMKHLLKEKLIAVQQKRYNRLFEKKAVTYNTWICAREKALAERLAEESALCGGSAISIKRIPYEAVSSYLTLPNIAKETADIILFQAEDGKEAELAEGVIGNFFLEHPQISIAYGDEDVLSPDGIRYTPWLKPDWSPDTFLSHFYFGSIFAVRAGMLKELSEEEIYTFSKEASGNTQPFIYRMCYLLVKKAGGFEKRGASRTGKEFPVGHIDEILFHSFLNKEMDILYNDDILSCEGQAGGTDREEKKLVSVIIPSKDNETVLKRCIESVKRSVKMPYEIILVDNGSEVQTKENITAYLNELGVAYQYIYRKMPFHFSAMCNMGAAAAAGEVYLFLNDDVEVPERSKENDWLGQLYAQAMKPYAGAVGVKLLYPDSDKVQHGGIVNSRLGPIHKLQFQVNNNCYYYSWNSGKRNVIAVTGACLAVTKEKFEQAGGFSDELPVAFNDVDLCFSLYEEGYYNAVMQDIVLYHWESLSRGQDEERNKLERLQNEKRKLYERHKEFYGSDPFYHKYFAGDMLTTGFELKSDYEWAEDMRYGKPAQDKALFKGAREDACVKISLEYAGSVAEWQSGIVPQNGQEYYIQGFSFVAGSDNACYEKYIMLQKADSDEPVQAIKPEILLRKDVEQNLPDQINVGMTGFRTKLRKQDIGAGSYRIGILVKDKCSGQKLFSWTNRYLETD